MGPRQRIAALLIWSTSATGIGMGLAQLGLPVWAGLGAGGFLTLALILEAGKR